MATLIPQVNEYIDGLSGEIQEISQKLRATIFEVVPEAMEELKWGVPCYSKTKSFCYFKATKKHVNLGFDRGAELDDPHEMLEGTGKLMRHVKLKPGQAFPEERIRALIKQAAMMV